MAFKAKQTAIGTAALRAIERYTAPEQRLFDDPLAKPLCGPVLGTLLSLFAVRWLREPLLRFRERKAPGVLGGLLCRFAYLDDVLRDALEGNVESVVILGAGLDSRPYRIPGADSACFFEVDQPSLLDTKRHRLARCLGALPSHVRYVPIDFDTQDLGEELSAAGYDSATRTLFIWEGVSQYISREALEGTLRYVGGTASGNRMAFSYVLQSFIDDRSAFPDLGLLWDATCKGEDSLWKCGLDRESLPQTLAGFCLRIVEDMGSSEHEARYLKPKGRSFGVFEIERTVLAEVVEARF